MVKVPVEGIYTFCSFDELIEKEYMVPDYISQEEFIRSFRWDKFVTIYRFLVNDVGLDILPEDLGMTDSDLSYPDVDKIDMFIGLNTVVDPMINKIQADIMR